MKGYLDLLRHVLEDGEQRTDRTGVGTYSVFGTQTRYDLREGFPLVTTKKVPFTSVVRELLWFLRGSTNVGDLGCKIWDPWADEHGDLGPIYGAQWRSWGGRGVDQISAAINMVRNHPDSRRNVVSAWNVEDLPQMRLPPCHAMFQLMVSSDRQYLDMQMYQRSADLPVGVPFNIASYSLLLAMIANECDLEPRYFIHTIGDAHVYLDQVAGVQEQLVRNRRLLPKLVLQKKRVLDMQLADVRLENYDPHPVIQFPVAV
ncbi:MAG: thymidylate synthase [Kofleriaceae bacterium]